jgi:predicted kinase
MNYKQCITFAGAVGSSKTPIANYLSGTLNLPVLNNDAIRTEVTEDMLIFDTQVYEQRQEKRCKAILKTGNSFIYDASVDRKWLKLDSWLKDYGYRFYIISMDLSYDLLVKLYKAKKYDDTEQLKDYFKQHENFLSSYDDVVGLHIRDDDFTNRLQIAYEQVAIWLKT